VLVNKLVLTWGARKFRHFFGVSKAPELQLQWQCSTKG